MKRLVVASNRVALPKAGRTAPGGLAVGVMAAFRENDGLWFGWNGRTDGRADDGPELQHQDGVTFATLALSREEYRHYYKSYANGTLWPLFHQRLDLFNFQRAAFEGYRNVNARFARELKPLLDATDLIWIHDFHLIPMGAELRRNGVASPLGFFLHTPFPPLDVLRALPPYRQLLEALCEYDVVGFQTATDQRAFLDSTRYALGAQTSREGDVLLGERRVRSGVFPIGVDVEQVIAQARQGRRSRSGRDIRRSLSRHELIIGIDRIDYSKGLAERFQAFRQLLQRYPNTRDRVVLMQIGQPSRSDVPEYRDIRRHLDEIAGEIMGHFADYDWTPIRYLSRSFSRPTVLGLLAISQVGLVTPLRDGMNLVAKEFVAAQDANDPGVLVLSELAGAACQLSDALLVNPYDIDGVADTLITALSMPKGERRERWQGMMDAVERYDVFAWCDDFLNVLAGAARASPGVRPSVTSTGKREMDCGPITAPPRLWLGDQDSNPG